MSLLYTKNNGRSIVTYHSGNVQKAQWGVVTKFLSKIPFLKQLFTKKLVGKYMAKTPLKKVAKAEKYLFKKPSFAKHYSVDGSGRIIQKVEPVSAPNVRWDYGAPVPNGKEIPNSL